MSDRIPDRYSRQALFAAIGAEGQRALMKARVAVVGCGGLGSLQATLLARAGVGALRLIDRDFVEESNLQRQLLYTEDDARTAQPKAVAAARALRLVNSQIEIEGLVDDLDSTSAARLRNGGKVMREIGSILSAMESDTVVSLFRENDVPCMPVLMLDQIAERIDDVCPGMIETSQHPILGAIQQPRPPVSFDGRHGRTASSPALGADTDAVLVEAGVQPEEIVEMRLAGLVR